MYSNSDWGWYVILAPYALVILLALALTVRSLKHLIKNYRQPRHYALERLALGSFVAGLLLLISFWQSNSTTPGAPTSYTEPQLGAVLLGIGVLLSFIAYPPHHRTAIEKAAAKSQRAGWPFWRQHKYMMLLIIIGLLVLGLIGYERISQVQNQRDFEQAREAIDSIYDNVVKNVGQPDNTVNKNDCARSHEEFSAGDLTCYINRRIIYPVNNEGQANLIFKQIQSLVSKIPSFNPTRSLSTDITDSVTQTYDIHSASDSYNAFGLNCVINYVYDTPREMDLTIKDPNKTPFEITIGCYGPAKKQYYQLAQ